MLDENIAITQKGRHHKTSRGKKRASLAGRKNPAMKRSEGAEYLFPLKNILKKRRLASLEKKKKRYQGLKGGNSSIGETDGAKTNREDKGRLRNKKDGNTESEKSAGGDLSTKTEDPSERKNCNRRGENQRMKSPGNQQRIQ